jgi:hypothetical protein
LKLELPSRGPFWNIQPQQKPGDSSGCHQRHYHTYSGDMSPEGSCVTFASIQELNFANIEKTADLGVTAK